MPMTGLGPGGADDFLRLSKALKAAGEKELRKELHKSIRDAAKPISADLKDAARRDLPKRGGLNEHVAKSRVRIATRTGRVAGVDVVFPQRQPGYVEGSIRHPVFAKKDRVQSSKSKRKDGTAARYSRVRIGANGDDRVRWVRQNVDGDWFDGTLRDSQPIIAKHIQEAIENMVERIAGSA